MTSKKCKLWDAGMGIAYVLIYARTDIDFYGKTNTLLFYLVKKELTGYWYCYYLLVAS